MSYREWKAWKKEQKLKSKKKKKASSKILIDSSDDLDSDHKRRSFCNSSKSESSRDKKKLEYHRVSHDYTFQLPSDHGASIHMENLRSLMEPDTINRKPRCLGI